MDDVFGAPVTASASSDAPPLIVASAGNATLLVPAVPTTGPMFVQGGPGPNPPTSMRTPAEVVEAAARVSRREAEASAREARAAERESALFVAESTWRASRDERAASVLAVAVETEEESTACAAVDVRASNIAVAANLDRRETAVRHRERVVTEREQSSTAVAVAERERVAVRREAAATMMADDARRRLDAVDAWQRESDLREATLGTRERVLLDLAGVTRAREAACVAREAKLLDDELAAHDLFAEANARLAAAEAADAVGRQRAAEVDGAARDLAELSTDLTARAATLALCETATASLERELAEKHAAAERSQTAVAEAGTHRAEALDLIQSDLEGREGALDAREAAASTATSDRAATEDEEQARVAALFEALELARREVSETREVATTATDIARQLEEVVLGQRALLDVAGEDREALMLQVESLMKRVQEAQVLKNEEALKYDERGGDQAENETETEKLRAALARCEEIKNDRDSIQTELEKAKRRALLTGHVAGSVGEYVRAMVVQKERYVVLEKEKNLLERKLAAFPQNGQKTQNPSPANNDFNSEVAAAREAAVALAEVATASVKAELDAVRLELAAAKASGACAKSAAEAELGALGKKMERAFVAAKKETKNAVETPSHVSETKSPTRGSPRSGKKPPPQTPHTPPFSKTKRRMNATPSVSGPASTGDENDETHFLFSIEKRVETAERAARSLVHRVRLSSDHRVEVAERETQSALENSRRLTEDLEMARVELDAAVAAAARAEAFSFGETNGFGIGKNNKSESEAFSFSSRIARLDAAFAAACATLEVLCETTAMARLGGWAVVSETLEANTMEGLRTLERLARDEENERADRFSVTFGKAGSVPETRMCVAVREVVAAVRDAAAVAAMAEERA